MKFKQHYFKESIDWNDHIKNNPELATAVSILKDIQRLGYSAVIVGGFVRDLLMNKTSKDIDLSSNCPIEVLEKNFDTFSVGPNQKEKGVIVIRRNGFEFEVCQYRKDLYNTLGKGKGADKVEITTSFKDDSSRRDFGLNAIGIDADGNIIDFHGGLEDIKNKIISFVGDPKTRIIEDPVRLMRGVRFSSKLGFRIEDKTMEAIKQHAPEIKKVAPERISQELFKMADAEGETFAKSIQLLLDTGLMGNILPSIVKLAEKKHSVIHHPEGAYVRKILSNDDENYDIKENGVKLGSVEKYDPNNKDFKDKSKYKVYEGSVLDHVIEAIKANKLKDSIVNLSLLLHDIGKNVTHKVDENGINHFFGHASAAIKIIEEIAVQLKLDTKTKEALIFSAENHMKFHDFLKLSNSTIAKLMDSPYFEILKAVALSDQMARGKLFNQQEWDKIEDKILEFKNKYKDKKIIDSIKKILNGKFILSLRPDIKPGPILGDIIKDTVDYVLNDNLNPESDMDKIKNFIKSYK